MKVFIDTSVFVALLVENETDHEKVAQKYRLLRQERVAFLTSDYILDELFTRLLFYKVDIRKHIKKIKDSIDRDEVAVLHIDESLFEKSLEVFLKFSDQKISFTDATTYVLYKDFALDEVFTLDDDFRKMRARTSFGPHVKKV